MILDKVDFESIESSGENQMELDKVKYSNYRMYILIKEQYPPSVAINSTAHGAMGAYIAWKGISEFEGWKDYSYRKITCVVNDQELININKVIERNALRKLEQIENRLNGEHILTVVFPIDMTLRENKAFKFLRLYT